MSARAPAPPTPPTGPVAPEPWRYEPPRLTGKQALAQVTLFSGSCVPGTPGCSIGHP